jgi:ABC-type transport system involved in cytochrome c biogenesis permease subunit
MIMNRTAITCLLAAATALAAAAPLAHAAAPAWPADVLDTFAKLPVQDGGRVKPLDTYAQFALLSINGKRSFTTLEGEKRNHLDFMLDALFFPEVARGYEIFLVNTFEVIEAMGVPVHEKKRDRYSYDELMPGREKLMTLAEGYRQMDMARRSPTEQGIIDLDENVFRFEMLTAYLDFAAGGKAIRASELVPMLAGVAQELTSHRETLGEERMEQEMQVLGESYNELLRVLNRAQALALVPHPEARTQEWLRPGEIPSVVDRQDRFDELMPILAHFETMAENREAFLAGGTGDGAAFQAALGKLSRTLIAMAEARREYGKVPLEVFYYKSKMLFYAQWLFVLSFILVAFTWLAPRSRVLGLATHISVLLPTVLLIAGITVRCIIRGRPPVTTLYETLLFVTAVAVVTAYIAERITKRGMAISVGAFLGMLGLFLASAYEAKEGIDTMPSLIAVLNTNFWLSTHVTTVTMGYSAGLLAAAIAHLYIIGRAFGIKRNDKSAYKLLTRMTYGVLCFGVLFSTVGTVLGGIWANDSWGRFWGWDPKENGALLIVLWGLIILHARMGGYIRDLGINISAVILGMIVAFSWWGTNLLGVGLHSYGFTHGIWRTLMIFWGIETLVVLIGFAIWLVSDKNSTGGGKKTGGEQLEERATSA